MQYMLESPKILGLQPYLSELTRTRDSFIPLEERIGLLAACPECQEQNLHSDNQYDVARETPAQDEYETMIGLTPAAVEKRRRYFEAIRGLHSILETVDPFRQYAGLRRVQLDNGHVHWFCPHHAAMAAGRVDLAWHSAPSWHNRTNLNSAANVVAERLWPHAVPPLTFDRTKYFPTRHPGPSSAERTDAELARASREARANAVRAACAAVYCLLSSAV